MTDGEALLRAVLDEPGDDTHRLVYADWCEENGQAERGEFVRVQLELARLEADPARTKDPVHLAGYLYGVHKETQIIKAFTDDPSPCRCESCLRKRSDELLLAGRRDWLGMWCRDIVPEGACFDDHVTFRRGFAHAVRCDLWAWLGHGAAVIRAHPVGRVGATDKTPEDQEGGHYWWKEDDPVLSVHGLPRAVYDLLPGKGAGSLNMCKRYPSRAAAVDALSVALLLHAHQPQEQQTRVDALLKMAAEMEDLFAQDG